MDLKNLFNKNLKVFLISLIVLVFGFVNLGFLLYLYVLLPLIFISSLIYNIVSLSKNQGVDLKNKILFSILASFLVTLTNFLVVFVISSISVQVFSYEFMVTRF